MKLIVTPDTLQATATAAAIIAETLSAEPASVLGLATGRTMEGVYGHLVRAVQSRETSFSEMTSFNLDEYVGLSASDPHSYRHYMQEHLFDHVRPDPARVHVPCGAAADLDAECAAYEKAIADAGGIALQLLGIGNTGHIGFNEPPSLFDTRTRVVELDDETREQNASMFGGDADAVPSRAITMGVGTILDAGRLLLLATGRVKARIIADALEGPVSPQVSASAIRLHHDVTVILDEDAASNLSPETRARAVIG
ncbi:glucosamine-6-phosphate deaminase [Brytella acorum]|uniref:Glucosamine-6-phosphate deaminase n=1 Tax=Brytella acorum TaxID=2959299 RepID=A0AA35V3N9_9PROT|nr:glucosamine-6-phosphate deaminase [Brytella acorum]MDF3625225.1 glucosamine-6-phosphate deaminase [Brytella acorum]CAI9119363.1 glucosamine-6-phosphate deaminase [Brytella acorum]